MSSTSIKRTLMIAKSVLKNLGTPRALSIYILLEDGSDDAWSQLLNMEWNPLHYLDNHTAKARNDLCATQLLSKIPNFRNLPLRDVAIEKFLEGEASCKLTNERIIADWNNPDLDKVRIWVSRLLGKAPSPEFVFEAGGFGPGATTTISRRDASPDLKAINAASCTLDMARLLGTCAWPDGLSRNPMQLVPGNLVTTVPKNAKTDRTIAAEPDLNAWFQKGLGNIIRKKLQRYGVDLNDQSHNQWGASVALFQSLATIDLRNASNTISAQLIFKLLPLDWFNLLYASRSHRYTLNDRQSVLNGSANWAEYQMWSSMGNGYTFELESLIFFAAALAAGCHMGETFIYGDDIIVPQSKALRVVGVLNTCGFEINPEKSFLSGVFFESCGVFSFNGEDVTPVKIKDLVDDLPSLLVLANKLRHFAWISSPDGVRSDRRFLSSYRMLVEELKATIALRRKQRQEARGISVRPADLKAYANKALQKLRGPVGIGGCLWSTVSEARPTYSRRRGGLMFSVAAYTTTERWSDDDRLLMVRVAGVRGAFEPAVTLNCGSISPGNIVKTPVTTNWHVTQTSCEQWSTSHTW